MSVINNRMIKYRVIKCLYTYCWHSSQNRRELPKAAKRQQQQYEISLFTFTRTAVVILTLYQCEKQKSVVIMSTLHPDVEIFSHNNPKKKPDTVLFYNKIKRGLTSLIRWPGNTL